MLPDHAKVKSILAAFPEATVGTETVGLVVRLAEGDVVDALATLKASDLDFVMLVDLLGADTGEAVEVTYHLRSFAREEDLFVKAEVAYGGVLRSVWNTYPSALLPERETAELLGLTLAGHPNPKRLLTIEGEEPLLRKTVAIRTPEEVRDR